MNFGSHLNYAFLTSLLDKNPLQLTSHLHISRLGSHLEKWQNRTNVVHLINFFNEKWQNRKRYRSLHHILQSHSQKTVHLGEEAMRMVLSRMPVLTSLKVKNIKIIIAKFIFRIIMIIPILWMRIRMILQLLTSLEVLSQDDVYWQHWYYQFCQLNTGDVDLNPQSDHSLPSTHVSPRLTDSRPFGNLNSLSLADEQRFGMKDHCF